MFRISQVRVQLQIFVARFKRFLSPFVPARALKESYAEGRDDEGVRSYVHSSARVMTLSTSFYFFSSNVQLTFSMIACTGTWRHLVVAVVTMQLTILKSANGCGLWVDGIVC